MKFHQYSIVLVDLNPTIGSEISKTRPCLIISPNELNENLKTVIIAPITNSVRLYPSRFAINSSKTNGFVALDQIKTIDKKRVIKLLGKINNLEIQKAKDLIMEIFVN